MIVLQVTPAYGQSSTVLGSTASQGRGLVRGSATPVLLQAAYLDGDVPANKERQRGGLRTLWVVFAEVRRSDIVHLQDATSWVAVACVLSAWFYQRPTIITLSRDAAVRSRRRRSWRGRLLAGPAEGWVVRAAVRVEVADPRTRDQMLAHGVEPARVALLGEEIDIEVFRPVSDVERTELRRRHDLPVGGSLVLFGGVKPPPAASRSYRQVQVRHAVGGRPPGEGSTIVVAATDQRHLAELYQACDLYVRPESAGDLTVAAQHAMACGLPVVSADDLCVEDYGLDRSGLRLYERSGEGLETAVDEVLRDGVARARMAAYSRRTSQEQFSWTRNAVTYCLYENVATRPMPAEPVERGGVSRQHLLRAVMAALVVTVGLVEVIRGPLAHQAALSLRRQPERYTELFFPRPLRLPTEVSAGGHLTFSFAVSNHGDAAGSYRYTVTESGARGTIQAEGSDLQVAAGQTVEHPVDIPAASLGSVLTVRVSVAPSGLSVAFHVSQADR
jgi:hypothetical protein